MTSGAVARPRDAVDARLGEAGKLTLPDDAFAGLFAHRFGVPGDVVAEALSGSGGTRRLPVAVAVALVASVGARSGRDEAARVAGGDRRVAVREAVDAAPTEPESVTWLLTAEDLAAVVFSGSPPSSNAQVAVGFDAFIEVLAVAVAGRESFHGALAAGYEAVVALDGIWATHKEVGGFALGAAEVFAHLWADATGAEPPLDGPALDGLALPAVPAEDAVAAFCAVLLRVEGDWVSLPQLPAGFLGAVADTCVAAAVWDAVPGGAKLAAAVAALVFEVTGSVDATLALFGGCSVAATSPEAVAELTQRWFPPSRRRRRAVGSPASLLWGAVEPPPLPTRPIDELLELFTDGGTRVCVISHECLGLTTERFSPQVATAFWHPAPAFARDVVDEVLHLCSGRFGHRWDPVEVLEVVEGRGEEYLNLFLSRVPVIARDLAGTGFALPELLVRTSMRAVGLKEWSGPLPELVVAELCDAAAAHGLGRAGWDTVWALLPTFRGTPAELVDVALMSSPSS